MTFGMGELAALAGVLLTIISVLVGMVRFLHTKTNERMTRELKNVKDDLSKDVARLEGDLKAQGDKRDSSVAELHRRVDAVREDLANTPTKKDFQNAMGAITNVLEALRQDMRHVSGRVDTIFERLPPKE